MAACRDQSGTEPDREAQLAVRRNFARKRAVAERLVKAPGPPGQTTGGTPRLARQPDVGAANRSAPDISEQCLPNRFQSEVAFKHVATLSVHSGEGFVRTADGQSLVFPSQSEPTLSGKQLDAIPSVKRQADRRVHGRADSQEGQEPSRARGRGSEGYIP